MWPFKRMKFYFYSYVSGGTIEGSGTAHSRCTPDELFCLILSDLEREHKTRVRLTAFNVIK